MANQMIALQARNPQLPDPARITAQYANMMNTAAQQRASQLQGQRLRQEMDYARAGEDRARETHTSAQKKAEIEYVGLVADQFSRDVAKLKEGDIAGAEALRADIVAKIPAWGNYIRPASEWTQDYRVQLMLKGKEIADKTIPDVTVSKEYAAAGARDAQGNLIPEGTVVDTRVGGFFGAAGSTPLKARSEATPAPRATPTAPPVTAGTDVDMRATRGVNTTPQDLIEQGMDPNNIPLGMPTSRPASFNQSDMGGAGAVQMTPDVMSRIVDSAFQTGVMAQVDFDQLLASQPPQNKQALVDSFRRANITLQADAPSLAASAMDTNPVQTPQSQFAVMRGEPMQSQTAGLRGAPPMEQTLAQYIPVQRKDPNVAPYPGSAQVPLSRLGAEKTTETQATKNVELEMAPKIAAASKNAERAIELKSEATKAKYTTESLLNDLADRINTVDRLLRNRNRFSIVGPIEGNLPRLMQYGPRADAQAAFDKIKNTATLTSLIDMRKSTQTGASPVGANPTDKDAKIVEQAASELIQTGEPSKFDANLLDIRRKLYRTFVSAQREYDGVYGDVLKDNPRLRLAAPKVSDRYLSSKDIPKTRTSTKVDRNNPLLRGM